MIHPILACLAGITFLAFGLPLPAATNDLQSGLEATAALAPNNELLVAAAADLKFAMEELSREFQKSNPLTKVTVSYGSSGNFFAQIQNGAPFDLFFSADIAYPQKLAEAGLGANTNVFTYGVGHIVLWAPKSSAVDVTLGFKALLDPAVRKIAIANPKHAPYGRAAEAALRSLNVYEQTAPRLVFGENVVQTAQFVQSGAADAGIIGLSLALSPQMCEQGKWWEVPSEAHPRMNQGVLILKSTRNLNAATAFRDFVLGEHGRATLKRYGFGLPER